MRHSAEGLLLPHWNPWGRRADFDTLAARSACSWNSGRLQVPWPEPVLTTREWIGSRETGEHNTHTSLSWAPSWDPTQLLQDIRNEISFRAEDLFLGFTDMLYFNLKLHFHPTWTFESFKPEEEWKTFSLSFVYPPPRLNLLHFSMHASSYIYLSAPFSIRGDYQVSSCISTVLCFIPLWQGLSLNQDLPVFCLVRFSVSSRNPTVSTTPFPFQ